MVLGIVIALVSVVALFLIFVATRPAAFRIERSIVVAAPAQKAFDRVNDFHEWAPWSPWEKLDPNMKRTYSGAAAGTGAVYQWEGKKCGEGRMTIEKSIAPSLVSIKLEFFKPFKATNTASFAFATVPQGTRISWAMEGNHTFQGKLITTLVSMDKMCGKDFERGLAALKSLTEQAAQPHSRVANAAS